MTSSMKVEKVMIIGSGPAGHTAAIYTARANLEPLMLEGFMAGGVAAGGQLTTTTDIENFPGFPRGIGGPKLMEEMREQSLRYGTRIETETVTKVDLGRRPFLVRTEDQDRLAETLIIATGATQPSASACRARRFTGKRAYPPVLSVTAAYPRSGIRHWWLLVEGTPRPRRQPTCQGSAR